MDATCLRDVVYEGLKQAIVEGKILTGSRIVEKRFADQMNISRTPVREALKKLESEGLIEHVPNVGAVVKCIDENEILSLYKAKHALESIVLSDISEVISESDVQVLNSYLEAAEAAIKAGESEVAHSSYASFQTALVGLSKNKMIFAMLKSLEKTYNRTGTDFELRPADYNAILQSSRALIDSLATGDLTSALEVNYNRHMTVCECMIRKLKMC
jgi:DNA-binding GntR family transcriptional regulator